MAALTIEMQRRRAEVTLDESYRKVFGVDNPVQLCYVLGLFQETDGDFATPVFVCELDTGDVIRAQVDAVKFIDTAGGDLI